MLVYGRNVFERIIKDDELLKKVRKIKIEDKYYAKIKNLLGEFPKSRIEITRNHEIDNLTTANHQGIIVDMEDYQYTPFNKIIDKEYSKVVILDHILDPYNFGAIIRTAVAASIEAIIIPSDRQVLVNSTVVKTSVGAVFDIDIVTVTNLNNTIKTLKDNGFWIYGTVMNGEDYREVHYNDRVCLIIGNEEKGISRLVKENSDFLITIPISSKIDSLNASVAAGILIYEVVRSRK